MTETITIPQGALIRLMFDKQVAEPQVGYGSGLDEATIEGLFNLTRHALHEHEPAGALMLTSEDSGILEKAEFVLEYLSQRLPELESTEMRELIDLAMPRLITRPTVAALKQAKWNAELRTSFLTNYPTFTSAEVHAQYGSTAVNRSALAANWRRDGKIFAVENRGEFLYPAFQFDDAGRPKPIIAAILKQLHGAASTWQTAIWFVSPNSWLDGSKPIDLLDKDETALLMAAERETQPLEF